MARRLTFERRDGAIVDTKTGSEWNIFGEAVSGPLGGAVAAARHSRQSLLVCVARLLPRDPDQDSGPIRRMTFIDLTFP